MTTYNKSKSGGITAHKLQAEINEDVTIVPSCNSISTISDNITLEFAAALSAGEETTLDALIVAHDPIEESIPVAQLPFSDIGNKKEKLAVHTSYKPVGLTDSTIYAVWTGAGDDMTNGNVGEGNRLEFHMTPGNPEETVLMGFHPDNGRIWIHEGYIQFTGAGFGDYCTAEIRSLATNVQTAANLDLVLAGSGNWVLPAPGGPGTGTHGFADANIALIPRTFTKDGEWDFDPITGLSPNLGLTGDYRIATSKKTVHKFINQIPLFGTTSYVEFSSDETTELPANYEIRLRVFNISNTDWHLAAFIECYRERTAKQQ